MHQPSNDTCNNTTHVTIMPSGSMLFWHATNQELNQIRSSLKLPNYVLTVAALKL